MRCFGRLTPIRRRSTKSLSTSASPRHFHRSLCCCYVTFNVTANTENYRSEQVNTHSSVRQRSPGDRPLSAARSPKNRPPTVDHRLAAERRGTVYGKYWHLVAKRISILKPGNLQKHMFDVSTSPTISYY